VAYLKEVIAFAKKPLHTFVFAQGIALQHDPFK
jgi:hypothetical protein